MMNYKNRYLWMTAKLRSQIIEKISCVINPTKKPGDLVLTVELRQKRNKLTSDLRNVEIWYYSKHLGLNKSDL